MKWKKIPLKSKKEEKENNEWIKKKCKKSAKFLCDENLPADTAERLVNTGYNAISVFSESLNGQSDENIFMFAYKKGRVLLTADEDFWDNRNFELQFATPTIILPQKELNKTLPLVLRYIAPYIDVFKQTKVKVFPEKRFIISSRDNSSGAIEEQQLRFNGRDFEELLKD